MMRKQLGEGVMKLSKRPWTVAILAFVVVVAAGAAWIWRASSRDLARYGLPAGVVGCWALFDADGRRAEGSLYRSPSIVRLDSAQNTVATRDGPGTVRLVHRLDSLRRPMDAHSLPPRRMLRRFSYWIADSLAQRIRIRFSSGLSGSQFVFALPDSTSTRDTLTGRATEHWDIPPYRNGRGQASAVRVACLPGPATSGATR